jgi:hypothetical protein
MTMDAHLFGVVFSIFILLVMICAINWYVRGLRERVEKLERAVRELNPGLDI